MERSAVSPRYSILYFTALAYLISWIIWLPLYGSHLGIHGLTVVPYHHALGALGPFLVAFIMTYVLNGISGVRELGNRLIQWKLPIKWHLIAWLSPFLLSSVALLIAYLSKGEPVSIAGMGVSKEFPEFGIVAFLLYNIFSFGYGEETGWRGFVLPRLQARYNALWASILLTFIWAGWHIPLFFYRPGYTSMEVASIIGWLLSLFTGSILLTWLYNSSKGSILIVSIFHATIDVAFTSTAVQGDIANYMGMLITFWAIILVFIVKPRNLSRESRQKFFDTDTKVDTQTVST
jgi:membrane protease YdiL (CAAX protease family)